MRKLMLILTLIAIFYSGGCAIVPTKRDLRKDNNGKFSVIVEENYQQTYRKFMDAIHKEPKFVWFADQELIENVIYTDTKTAYIRICRNNALAGEYLQSLRDIKAITDKKTKITIYYLNYGIHNPGKLFRESIKKMYKGCKIIEI